MMFRFPSLSSSPTGAGSAPPAAASGGGAGGGKVDEDFSATLLLVLLELVVVSFDTLAALGRADETSPPSRVGGFSTAGRVSSALEWYEACALRAVYLIRPNKLGSSGESSIGFVKRQLPWTWSAKARGCKNSDTGLSNQTVVCQACQDGVRLK